MIAALAQTQPIDACKTLTVHLIGLKINHNQTKRDSVNELVMASILQNPEKKGEAQSFGFDTHFVVFKSKLVRHATGGSSCVILTMFHGYFDKLQTCNQFG